MTTQFNGRITPVMQRILDALERDGDMDAHDLADAACTCHNSLSGGGYLRKLITLGFIRVSAYRRNYPGAPTPIYSITEGDPATPPKRFSCAKRTKRWRQKVGYRSAEYRQRQTMKELVRITA